MQFVKEKKYYIPAAIALAFLLIFVGFFEYSASPGFCKSCHVMKPYYNAWASSKHKKVACVKCHYPPGMANVLKGKIQAAKQVVAYFTNTYSTRFYSEIEDASCLRKGCHERRLLADTTVLFKQNIQFSHKHHLEEMKRGKKLRCTSCHSQLVVGEHIAVTEKVCFLCHFKDRVDGIHPMGQEFCTKCHPSPSKDIEIGDVTYNHKEFVDRGVPCQSCHLEAVKGNGNVDKSKCYTCHAEPERLKRFNEGEFMHLNHVTNHKVECNRCHEEITHSVKTMIKPLDYSCEICHASTHNATKDMYMGQGGKGIQDEPSHMFKVHVACIGCHINDKVSASVARFTGQTFEPSEKGCAKCHGDDVTGMLEDWKSSIAQELRKTEGLLRNAKTSIQGKTLSPEAKKLLDDAEYNYEFVKFAKGVHNITYATDLLSYADSSLNTVLRGK
jgi:hypothetical protein